MSGEATINFLSAFEILQKISDKSDVDVYKSRITYFNTAISKQMLNQIISTASKADPANVAFKIPLNITKDGVAAREKLLQLIREKEVTADSPIWNKPVAYTNPKNFLSDAGKRNAIFRKVAKPEDEALVSSLADKFAEMKSLKPNANGDVNHKSSNFEAIMSKHFILPGATTTNTKPTNPVSDDNKTTDQQLPPNFATEFSKLVLSVSGLENKIEEQSQTIAETARTEFQKFWTEQQLNVFSTKILGQIQTNEQFNGLIDNKISDKVAKLELNEDMKALIAEEIKRVKEQFMTEQGMRMQRIEERVDYQENRIVSTENRIDEAETAVQNLTMAVDTIECADGSPRSTGRTELTEYEIRQAFTEAIAMSKDYHTATVETLQSSLVTIILMDKALFTRSASDIIQLKHKEIETVIKHQIAVLGFPTETSKNKYPVFNCKLLRDLEGTPMNAKKLAQFLNKRNIFKGKLTIKITAPPKFSIRMLISNLIKDEIIFDTIDTQKGKLAIYINDGDKTIPNRRGENYNQYRDTCTFFTPQHPMLIARLRNPSIEKFRAVARSKHFIHPSMGMLVKKPAHPLGKPEKGFKISEFYMDEENESDLENELKNFIVSHNYL